MDIPEEYERPKDPARLKDLHTKRRTVVPLSLWGTYVRGQRFPEHAAPLKVEKLEGEKEETKKLVEQLLANVEKLEAEKLDLMKKLEGDKDESEGKDDKDIGEDDNDSDRLGPRQGRQRLDDMFMDIHTFNEFWKKSDKKGDEKGKSKDYKDIGEDMGKYESELWKKTNDELRKMLTGKKGISKLKKEKLVELIISSKSTDIVSD